MRRTLALLVMAAAATFGVTVGAAGSAGAQVLTCNFVLSTTSLPAGGGPVSVSGTAPGSTDVKIFVNGVQVSTVKSAPVTGAWGPVVVNITATSTITVSLDPVYATTPCAGAGGVEVASAAALPRTGSDTKQYLFAGASLIAVGLALVVGARRRRTAHSSS